MFRTGICRATALVVLLVAVSTLPAAEPARVLTIGRGQKIDIHSFVVPGRTTIFDFSSDFCGPCRRIAGPLETLVRGNAGLALRRVDINRPGTKSIDWRSPVAQQFNLSSIPSFIIFDAKGRVSHRGDDASDLVMRWLIEKKLIRP